MYNNLINEINAFAAMLCIDSVSRKTFTYGDTEITVNGTVRTVYDEEGDIANYETVLFDENGYEYQDGYDFIHSLCH